MFCFEKGSKMPTPTLKIFLVLSFLFLSSLLFSSSLFLPSFLPPSLPSLFVFQAGFFRNNSANPKYSRSFWHRTKNWVRQVQNGFQCLFEKCGVNGYGRNQLCRANLGQTKKKDKGKNKNESTQLSSRDGMQTRTWVPPAGPFLPSTSHRRSWKLSVVPWLPGIL